MAKCKIVVSPLLTHRRYCSLELRHRYIERWMGTCIRVTSHERHKSSATATVLSLSSRGQVKFVYMPWQLCCGHYPDVRMSAMASQITGVSIVCSTVCPGADQRKQQSSTSLAFAREIHRSPVNSPHKGPVTRKNVSIWWRHHGIFYHENAL